MLPEPEDLWQPVTSQHSSDTAPTPEVSSAWRLLATQLIVATANTYTIAYTAHNSLFILSLNLLFNVAVIF